MLYLFIVTFAICLAISNVFYASANHNENTYLTISLNGLNLPSEVPDVFNFTNNQSNNSNTIADNSLISVRLVDTQDLKHFSRVYGAFRYIYVNFSRAKAYLHTRNIMPSVTDPSIWSICCGSLFIYPQTRVKLLVSPQICKCVTN